MIYRAHSFSYFWNRFLRSLISLSIRLLVLALGSLGALCGLCRDDIWIIWGVCRNFGRGLRVNGYGGYIRF